MDKYVAQQYNNELPRENKKKKAQITVTSSLHADDSAVSNTVKSNGKLLPLVFYWHQQYRHVTSLNPAIAVISFTNTVNTGVTKSLMQKINSDQHLELNVEQVPAGFSLVDDAHMIWLIYAINWDKVYIEPEAKDLVVSYKLMQANNIVKNGRIAIKNTSQNKGLRYFQS